MLVLTRKCSQRILIGEDVTITVVRIDGNKVRIGIEAPREISIQREELTAAGDSEKLVPTAEFVPC